MSTCGLLSPTSVPGVAGRVRADRAGGDCGRRAQARRLICFPECYVPGYRGLGKCPPPPDTAFLERAWSEYRGRGGPCNVAVVLGTERVTDAGCMPRSSSSIATAPLRAFRTRCRSTHRRKGPTRRARAGACFRRARSPSACPSATRGGAIRKRCAGRRAGAPTSCSTRTITRPTPAATGPRRSPTRPTRSTRRPCCAGRRRTPATSPPSTTRATGRRPLSRGASRRHAARYQPYGQEGLLVADLDLERRHTACWLCGAATERLESQSQSAAGLY